MCMGLTLAGVILSKVCLLGKVITEMVDCPKTSYPATGAVSQMLSHISETSVKRQGATSDTTRDL